ncbi:TPA: BppU family phage baseplate upper protein [Bacillus pacificus]|nr:BppU family phage baseplate upper protein [Bacillus pacificus]
MTFKTYEINVDLVNDTSTTYSNRFSQNDRNSAKLLVTITNKGAEIDLSQAKSVRMSFKKPDGTRVFQNDCQPINAMKGKYQIVLKTQTLTSVGTVIAQIHIEEEDRIIDTQKFFFVVNDSLASDEAVESTNEFPVIQKAIEAGKKLEGVDINGIITAGVKADGALPKTGGTMTGPIKFNRDRGIAWNDGVKDIHSITTGGDNKTYFTDGVNGVDYAIYDPTTKSFNILQNTNLLKTTGGTMTGNFTLTSGAMIRQEMPNAPSARGILYIDETSKAAVGGIGYARSNSGVVGEAYMGWGNAPWEASTALIVSDTKFTYKNKPVAMRDKDGRADLVLTADATNFDTSRPPVAVRRGNTVTIRGAIGVSASATANLVTTLPTDMRPIDSLTQTILTHDGSATTLEVYPDGRVILSNSAKGKNIYIVFTYVVN